MDDPLLDSLLRAVASAPDDVPLRLHVATVLLDRGQPELALEHCSAILARQPTHPEGLALLGQATAALTGTDQPVTGEPEQPRPAPAIKPVQGFDWDAAEAQVGDIIEPAFVDAPAADPVVEEDIGRSDVRLADVAGMEHVKKRIELAFLAPMRNPELAKAYGKNLSGGLLLYGPPGCGKTFLARAVAGELGARFYPVSLADVLDMYIGQSEKNLHEIFQAARRNAPCVLFLDEIDALGQRRTQLRGSAMRGSVNQLLAEMDGVQGRTEGVFILAATNHPWDVDPALRRPGRFDRMLLVLPPDDAAREAIIRYHLRQRPVAGVDLGKLVKRTDGFSGADLAHICETATEYAMAEAARTGEVHPIRQADMDRAVGEVQASTGPWLQTARNVAMFANEGGVYDELLAYLKRRRLA
jgi:SpoVK/Ycf46/Vps4 family AAA+-type ATPase